MFNNLGANLSNIFQKLRGQARLTEENIQETLREIRVALFEADVALPVVKEFIEHIRTRAVGKEVISSINPGQALIKIVHDEMVVLMGEPEGLNLQVQPPVIILMAGLQGSGKTTTTIKLAKYLKEREQKKVLVTSADIYRPAAIEQLGNLAKSNEIDFCPTQNSQSVTDIVKNALAMAKSNLHEVVIIDTAGRLHIDEAMMQEIKSIHDFAKPTETLFVVDSMTGQDAANTAKAFHEVLPLTGIILTKTDGDARGGAALSVRQITGKPIKFIGIGEKTDALEPFHADRIVSRILGMGDVVSLVEQAERSISHEETKKLKKKLSKGNFDLDDFREQIIQMNKMGGIMGLASKLPGFSALPQAQTNMGEKALVQVVAIINSMTAKERRFPTLINGSRKRRIAKGSGTEIPDVNRLLKQFTQMQKMMKKATKPGAMQKMLRGMKGFDGMMPPGF
ncbi:MAG: signal recognition particle protein [Proteobacteria bacterium]|nr:signal recognition particle protein [Pseudomonadota bacterium]